ncbi:MFS transporter [Amycolatopsis regifaucium]|uniref:MFS transporter n=1 Tax=Amycolatopsis regifaucium TaxID=546365 RepID=A0A154ML64_9PSEU|nr:MFS transporter [Amycolatopsis regifaucium]KZB84109.1 MFS transporter [Amycolatopsis regifaucium]OKA08599.1 MFS transporter [Amycolatopsis regifaucium]SFJ54925.1 Fucose permease [Amycolatopsis regifaucium]
MRDRTAVFVVFALNGAALGSWAPRTPALSERVHASPGVFGLALLGASVGMLIAASVSGRLIERHGARAVVAGSTVIACAALPMIGFSTSVPLLAGALFVLGGSVGALDVAMNVAGVEVERRTGRAIMPVLHAGFSFGALAGSVAAGFAASHQWSPGRHLTFAAVAALVVLALVIVAVPGARPVRTAPVEKPRVAPIKRPVLWLLAAIALFSAIAEGASSDWSALLLTSAHGVGDGAAAFAYSGFSLAMAIARLAGAWLQNRFGATRALAVGAGIAAAGLVLAALARVPVFGFAGFALAGAGLAAAFPIALSLAGASGKRADGTGGERELAFVTAIAYTGFLAGPPLIGGIAQVTSLSVSFLFVGLTAALIVPSALAAARAGKREEVAEPVAR